MTDYILTLSEAQNRIVCLALEEYIALRENRWQDFLAETVVLPQNNTDTEKIFQEIMLEACDGRTGWDTENIELARKLLEMAKADTSMHVTADEARFLQATLEEYFRLRLNQWFDFTTDVATAGFVYNKDNPDNSRLFNEYISRRNRAQDQFGQQFARFRPWSTSQTIDMRRAQDIWQVIRYRLYLDRGGDPNSYVVDARPPMTLTGEPFPKFRLED